MGRTFSVIVGSLLTPGALFWASQEPSTAPNNSPNTNRNQSVSPQRDPSNQSNRNSDRQAPRRTPNQNPNGETDNRNQTNPNARDTSNQRAVNPNDDRNRNRANDFHLAAVIAAQHQLQVNMGQLGQERASSDAVREFASRLVQEHGEFLNRLAALNLQSDNSVSGDADVNVNDPNAPDSNQNPTFDSPGRPGSPPQLRNRNNRRPNSEQPNTNPNDKQPNNQRNNRRPQQSAVDQSNASLILTVATSQKQRQDNNQPATGQRQNSSLVTPGLSPNRTPNPTDQDRDGNRSRSSGVNADVNAQADVNANLNSRFNTNNPLVQAIQQVSMRRMAMAESELRNLSGGEFDRAFMQIEIGLHIELVATQSAFASITRSREMQQILADGQQMDQEHLNEAQRISTGMHGNAAVGGDAGTGTNTGSNNNNNGSTNTNNGSVLDNSGNVPSRPNLRRPGDNNNRNSNPR